MSELESATPEMQWARLMETSFRRGANLLLVRGYPPVARLGQGVRALLTNSFDSERLSILMNEIMQKAGARISFSGAHDFYIRFGLEKFRIAAMGKPSPYAIFVTPLQSAPKLLTLVQQDWNATTDNEFWDQAISRHILLGKGDLILSEGMPLFAWDGEGIHPLGRSCLTSCDIKSYIDRVAPPVTRIRNATGFFTFIFSEKGRQVCAALFDGPGPLVLLLMHGSGSRDHWKRDMGVLKGKSRRRKNPIVTAAKT